MGGVLGMSRDARVGSPAGLVGWRAEPAPLSAFLMHNPKRLGWKGCISLYEGARQ